METSRARVRSALTRGSPAGNQSTVYRARTSSPSSLAAPPHCCSLSSCSSSATPHASSLVPLRAAQRQAPRSPKTARQKTVSKVTRWSSLSFGETAARCLPAHHRCGAARWECGAARWECVHRPQRWCADRQCQPACTAQQVSVRQQHSCEEVLWVFALLRCQPAHRASVQQQQLLLPALARRHSARRQHCALPIHRLCAPRRRCAHRNFAQYPVKSALWTRCLSRHAPGLSDAQQQAALRTRCLSRHAPGLSDAQHSLGFLQARRRMPLDCINEGFCLNHCAIGVSYQGSPTSRLDLRILTNP